MPSLYNDLTELFHSRGKVWALDGPTECFDITEPANYFWAHNHKDWQSWSEGFPCVAPAYSRMWVEGRRPLTTEIFNASVLSDRALVPHRWAYLLDATDLDEVCKDDPPVAGAIWDMRAIKLDLLKDGLDSHAPWFRENDKIDISNLRWLVLSTLFMQVEPTDMPSMGYTLTYGVSGNGQLIGQPVIDVAREYKKRVAGFEQELDLLRPVFFALSLMHCKNVKRIEHNAPDKLQKARVRRGKLPLIKHYTLAIDPIRKILETEGRIAQNGLKRSLHICRGHFSTYTEEKPLFGKISGKFWIPSHTRGSKEIGEVRKDYRVKAPGK